MKLVEIKSRVSSPFVILYIFCGESFTRIIGILGTDRDNSNLSPNFGNNLQVPNLNF